MSIIRLSTSSVKFYTHKINKLYLDKIQVNKLNRTTVEQNSSITF